MDFRKIFETVPEQFDKWRPRYCAELFDDLIKYAELAPGRRALEIGPGTGQATEPILKTGCDYEAIEIGETFSRIMTEKFGSYPNFKIMNADYETYDFESEYYDLVYSAAAIQWIPEKIAFSKAYAMLKRGGAFAMFMMRADKRPGGGYTDQPLFNKIQSVYSLYFHPEIEYTRKLDYDARDKYGFTELERREYLKTRTYSADDYLSLIGTHSDHITLAEPYRTKFFEGIRDAINDCGGNITLYDRITMYLARKS